MTANLKPVDDVRVNVVFDKFKILGLIPVDARGAKGLAHQLVSL